MTKFEQFNQPIDPADEWMKKEMEFSVNFNK